MKKFLITILAVFYLGVSSGATVHFHYCMGQLIDWGLSNDKTEAADTCSNCGMSIGSTENCCKDKNQELKVKDSQKAPLITHQAKIFTAIQPAFPGFKETLFPFVSALHLFINAPPRTQNTPVFIRNCSFRI